MDSRSFSANSAICSQRSLRFKNLTLLLVAGGRQHGALGEHADHLAAIFWSES